MTNPLVPIKCCRCGRIVATIAEDKLESDYPRIARAHRLVCSEEEKTPERALAAAQPVGLA